MLLVDIVWLLVLWNKSKALNSVTEGHLRPLRTMHKAYYFFKGGNFLDFSGGQSWFHQNLTRSVL